MDDCFDLDLSLTMEDHHPTTTSASATTTSTKTTELPSPEEAQNHVFAMPTVVVTSGVCTVCMEGFDSSSCTSGKQAPCGHIYHFDCITKWLSLHNSCPLCRSKVSGHRTSFPAEVL
ncbi:E3 ubiquitin-protein ligase RING1-like [Cynara cardunculus var. scolymus]|uniref:RING-type E3 ubiquitin transferase n=1 Tax=Cynara cardunculus var. scolymus TaxID=59895 RepID=A0A103Y2C6_CYNCS|nr:E3 ubiquitin-protein ligase RING1-like [Cynara cardunculus var. scolymus]KVI01234.1 Zinc finger, RING/FYVE/PHD-type [Cynara cardunculus var. scolymus]